MASSQLAAAVEAEGTKSPPALGAGGQEQGPGCASEPRLAGLGWTATAATATTGIAPLSSSSSALPTAAAADAQHQQPPQQASTSLSTTPTRPTSLIALASSNHATAATTSAVSAAAPATITPLVASTASATSTTRTTRTTRTTSPSSKPIPIPIPKTRPSSAASSSTPLVSRQSSLRGSQPPSPGILETPPASQPATSLLNSSDIKHRITNKLQKRRRGSSTHLSASSSSAWPSSLWPSLSSPPSASNKSSSNNSIPIINSIPPTPTKMEELPERLRDGDEANDDREDAPPTLGPAPRMNVPMAGAMGYDMSHSVFGMLQVAATQMDAENDRSDVVSSSDEGDDAGTSAGGSRGSALGTKALRIGSGSGPGLMARSLWHDKSSTGLSTKSDSKKHRRRLSESKMFRSLLHHRTKSLKKTKEGEPGEPQPASADKSGEKSQQESSQSDESEDLSQSRILSTPISKNKAPAAESSPSAELSDTVPPLPPVSSRIAASPSRSIEGRGESSALVDRASASGDEDDAAHQLALRLKQVFEFDELEEVINEYPCWLLRSVLLQGSMYVTARHVCFYAYLPRKQALVKAGYISKTGKRNPKYSRYWFVLKGDILTYSADASNVYFQDGHIDLQHAIEAKVSEKDRDGVHFTIEMPHRTYYLRADSAPSANDWVKCIQRVILRSHNDGDSVKISLPIDNIVDIEVVPMVDFAETCHIRVIDNDETFAIDDYYFSFFTMGKEAMQVLKILVEDSQSRGGSREDGEQQKIADPASEPVSKRTSTNTRRLSIASDQARLGKRKTTEPVKATLQPPDQGPLSPRSSSEVARPSFDAFKHNSRRSVDLLSNAATTASNEPAGRRSFATARRSFSGGTRVEGSKKSDSRSDQPASTESYVQSSMSMAEDHSLSAMLADSTMLEDQTASQMLRASDLFQGPTLPHGSDTQSSPEQGVKQKRPRSGSPIMSSPIMSSPVSTSAPDVSIGGPQSSLPEASTGWEQQMLAQKGVKPGTSPLERAGAWASFMNQASRRVGSILATESMGYVEKVSGMWKGGRKHYSTDAAGVDRQPGEHDESAPEKIAAANERFRAHFGLPKTEKLQSTYFCYIMRVLPLYGKLYVGNSHLCFRSLLPGMNTKLKLPLREMETVAKEGGFRFGYQGLVLVVRAHEELFVEFKNAAIRDDCAVTLLQILDRFRFLKESGQLLDGRDGVGSDGGEDEDGNEDERVALAERDALNETRGRGFPEHELKLPTNASTAGGPMILCDEMSGSFTKHKAPRQGMHITCLTIGSRGDVQPYIALAKGLMAEGHTVRIATHAEFQPWIESHGIEFRLVSGDPAKLMQLCILNGTFSWSFFREARGSFRGWLDEVLTTSTEACKGTDMLIESPSAMAGIHVAEALDIPYFRAFTMPWTRTRAYPHAFITPSNKMGGGYNLASYIMFEHLFWTGQQSQVNRWRADTLGLPPTSIEKLQLNKVPFLYNFSPLVVPPPLDYSDWIRVTGYWFLNEGSDWKPPQELLDFIARARADGKKLVYIGFGSIIVSNPAQWTQEIIDAVIKADVRCIFSTGWSDRLSSDQEDKTKAVVVEEGEEAPAEEAQNQGPTPPPTAAQAQALSQVVIPPEIHVIKSAPHDWLFSQVDAAAHHGGSGTTGASLRAGIPTIIKPFFGDQFFFANRVEDTGVGIQMRKWGSMPFGRALWKATHDERMITKARVLGESIRQEDGVGAAIQAIYRDYGYARSLISEKRSSPAHRVYAAKNTQAVDDGSAAVVAVDGAGSGDEDEPWTFIGHVPQGEAGAGALRVP